MGSLNLSNRESVSNGHTLVDTEVSPTNNGVVPVSKPPNSIATTTEDLYGNDDDSSTSDFIPPKYVPERSTITPVQSPIVPMSMQKV